MTISPADDSAVEPPLQLNYAGEQSGMFATFLRKGKELEDNFIKNVEEPLSDWFHRFVPRRRLRPTPSISSRRPRRFIQPLHPLKPDIHDWDFDINGGGFDNDAFEKWRRERNKKRFDLDDDDFDERRRRIVDGDDDDEEDEDKDQDLIPLKPSIPSPVDPKPSPFPLYPLPSIDEAIDEGDQVYKAVRDQCIRRGQLFEDPDFHAVDASLFYTRRPIKPFVWKRPKEIAENPEFFLGGASRFDVQQGELGDCWLLAAIANLTLYPALFTRVVPNNQGFAKDQYCGAFHFRIWQYGEWVDVIIDDRLPTFEGKLIFLRGNDRNEFWSALLEKAYAKLHGSYESLMGGSTAEAMEDFTGGVTEYYELRGPQLPFDLFEIIQKSMKRRSLLSAGTEPDPYVFEMVTSTGIVKGHAYSITGAREVDVGSRKEKLIRVRNPWGNHKEWTGAWSDQSREWQRLSESQRIDMGLVFDNDGEFWMSYRDFTLNMDKIEFCHLGPEAAEAITGRDEPLAWKTSCYEDSWVHGATAGGCRNFLETFAHNPQFNFTLFEADDDTSDGKCTVLIALLQKNRRHLKQRGLNLLNIGFAIYQLPAEYNVDDPLDREFFRTHASCGRSAAFINMREVTSRFRLNPGTYVVVPSTFEPNQDGEFLLRIFSEKRNELRDMEEDTGYRPPLMALRQASQDVESMSSQLGIVPEREVDIDCWKLKDILEAVLKRDYDLGEDPFSVDTCRSMIALNDMTRSGSLGVEGFKDLWGNVRLWQRIFKVFDVEKEGKISSFDLKEALKQAGYRLHSRLLKVLVLRYSSKDGRIRFDDFMACVVKLKTTMDIYRERDPRRQGAAKFDLDSWIELTMYA